MCLAKNIRYLRKKNGYSQDEIAEKLGYKSYTTIQKWEMGVSEPSISKLRELADLFNVDINDMAAIDLENNPISKGTPTIAAHLDTDDLTQAELDEVDNFIAFVRNKRKQ